MYAPSIMYESCLIVTMATEGACLSLGEPLDRSEAVSVKHMGTGQNYLHQGREGGVE